MSPILFIPFSLVSTVLFAMTTMLYTERDERVCSQTVVAVFYIATLVVTGEPLYGLFILLVFFPAGLAVGLSCASMKNLNSTGARVLVSSAVFCAILLFTYIIYTTYPEVSVSNAVSAIKGQIREIFDLLIAETGGDTAEVLTEFVFSYLPTAVSVWFLATGTVAYWFLKSVLRRFGRDVAFMDSFSEFKLSRVGAYTYFIASVVAFFSTESAFGYAFSNFAAVMSFILAYAGISLTAFFLDFKNVPKTVKYIVCTLLFILSVLNTVFMSAVSLIGLVDAYINVRDRLKNSGY